MLITEETHVDFSNYDQLSYQDKNEVIELFVDDFYIGDMEVWKDSEMEDREYICINYEVIYLDTIKKL